MAGRRLLAPAPPPAPLDGAVAGDSGQGGSHQRRLPCSSCTRRRPLRQCHTAARVTTWPTTTREGNRLPEGSMALGCPAADRAGRAALQVAVEAGNPLPSLRGGQMRRGGAGTRDRPACRTALPHCLPGAPRREERLVLSCTNCAPTRLLSLLPVTPLPTRLHGAQPSSAVPAQSYPLKVSRNLNPCLPTATPAGRRGLW